MSNADSENAATAHSPLLDGFSHMRSPSKTTTPAWSESHTQPKIFPGIVHERARRSSIRQGSGSEKDFELGGPLVKSSSRLGQGTMDDEGLHGAVVEEDDEGREL